MSNFVSIDIETTGLNENTCQTIEIGAVIDNWLKPLEHPPEFHCYVDHQIYQGEPYALSMHSEIFRALAGRMGYCLRPEDAVVAFDNWLISHQRYRDDKWTVAGKNYAGFDDRFLRKLPDWDRKLSRLSHRVIDPGNLFFNPLTDSVPPGTEECMKRAGVAGVAAHTALEDAKVVATLLQAYARSQ